VREFENESLLELRREENRVAVIDALAQLDQRLPLRVPVMVGAEGRDGPGFASTDPASPDRVVASVSATDDAEIDAAVRRAAAERGWRELEPGDRAEILIAGAARLRERRLALAALIVRECGKPWPEADADVCEAIDFLEYYARQAVHLADRQPLRQLPGERNQLRYRPRGVVAVISPWNFPLAIPAGMVAGALAAGNSVVLKPAEQSPATAAELVTALREAGVPPDALSLLPGEGDVGAALVRHPGVQAIAFTGSREVGLEIVRAAAEHAPGQRHIKHVGAELGGKNCVIADSDADLDEAVPAIVASAFGYAGQKCSAAARVLVHEAIYEPLLERLAGATSTLRVGPAAELETDVPPLITREAMERVGRYAALASREGEIVARQADHPEHGWFSAPTVVTGLPPDSRVLREEIFGPVLTVERVASVGDACAIVEELDYGLTGGLFSRNPDTVREVAERSPVGNLYVNREITGAMVSRQPFGGNRLSGTGAKPGGPDYLLQFTEPFVLTENTVRHGLVL
jgi:RHH-type transcriptional regulator, proline utilization regulon repressor / proline dehydrogenase / delta 1-pyrroline-5-carboxylate dehydrogenase